MYTRRAFLGSTAALAAFPASASATSATPRLDFTLETQTALHQITPDKFPETEMWCFNGELPGTMIRARQGEKIGVHVANRLPQPTTVHWHGLRIDNAMDGVPGLTQEPIKTGDSFDYAFDLRDAGTFWYHSHAQSVEQVERGLFGPLIVDEPSPPDVDRDETLVLDDVLIGEDFQIVPNFASRHARSHGGRLGNLFLTNGTFGKSMPVAARQRLRLRLINASNAQILELSLKGLRGWVMAYDGMPLDRPEPTTGQPFLLAPAQRMDLFVDVTAAPGEEAFLVRHERDGGYAQVVMPVSGQASAALRDTPLPLPANPAFELGDLSKAHRVPLHMQGGAMGGMAQAVLNGETHSMRELAAQNQFWAFNGVIGRTETPLADVDRGETLVISMRNDTAFPHAMHLHGSHFREIRPDGQLGPLRDTLLMMRGETRDIAYRADNPGDWLFHCHMLSHHAAGMGTWIRVRG